MNLEQAKSSARWLVSTFGGMVAGWFAAKGWFTIDQVTSILSSETTISVLASIGVGVWGYFVHTKNNAVAVVDLIAKEPGTPVKAVILDASPAGKELAASLPGDTTVVAGTTQAAAAARP